MTMPGTVTTAQLRELLRPRCASWRPNSWQPSLREMAGNRELRAELDERLQGALRCCWRSTGWRGAGRHAGPAPRQIRRQPRAHRHPVAGGRRAPRADRARAPARRAVRRQEWHRIAREEQEGRACACAAPNCARTRAWSAPAVAGECRARAGDARARDRPVRRASSNRATAQAGDRTRRRRRAGRTRTRTGAKARQRAANRPSGRTCAAGRRSACAARSKWRSRMRCRRASWRSSAFRSSCCSSRSATRSSRRGHRGRSAPARRTGPPARRQKKRRRSAARDRRRTHKAQFDLVRAGQRRAPPRAERVQEWGRAAGASAPGARRRARRRPGSRRRPQKHRRAAPRRRPAGSDRPARKAAAHDRGRRHRQARQAQEVELLTARKRRHQQRRAEQEAAGSRSCAPGLARAERAPSRRMAGWRASRSRAPNRSMRWTTRQAGAWPPPRMRPCWPTT
jgi:hypothetical protein